MRRKRNDMMYRLKYVPNESLTEKTIVVTTLDDFITYLQSDTVLAYDETETVYVVKCDVVPGVEKVFRLSKLASENPYEDSITYSLSDKSMERLFNKYVIKVCD